jgi:tripartite-type tricarboxylate transporter receptor subunit TctC
MMRMFRKALWAHALVMSLSFGSAAAHAAEQTYPSRPVRLVVPYPPGGATDVTGREISRQLSDAWGQSVVVDNRTGAAGTIGHAVVAKATPDGYTLVVGTFGGLVSGPALMGSRVPYDPLRDFTPIGLAVYTPWVLVVNPCEDHARQAQLRLHRIGNTEPSRHGPASRACGH